MAQATTMEPYVATIDIQAPIEKVWAEITKTGSVQRPLYNTVLETQLRPGAKLRYYSPNRKRVFVAGEVLEVDPPRRLKHTYHFLMNGHEPPTVVTWELQQVTGGTRVTVTHGGFTADHKKVGDQQAGWVEILGLLKAEVETGTIPLKTRIMYATMGAMSFMLPKTTKRAEVDRLGL